MMIPQGSCDKAGYPGTGLCSGHIRPHLIENSPSQYFLVNLVKSITAFKRFGVMMWRGRFILESIYFKTLIADIYI